jgi:hypothetical protein
MTQSFNVEVDGPTQSRSTIRFKNWKDEHGLVIRSEKLLQDAKNFRRIAKLLSGKEGMTDQEHDTYAQMLMTMADQFQNASCGWDAQAEAKPYDKPPEMAETPKEPA